MLGVVLVTACSTSPLDPAEVDNGSSSTRAQTVAPGTAKDIESRSDLLNEGDLEWMRSEVVDDTHIRVFFVGGNPKCHGIRTAVEETSSSIIITLREGTVPLSPVNCAAVAYEGSTLVSLAGPLAGRAITQAS
jgi:hypothetical protein